MLRLFQRTLYTSQSSTPRKLILLYLEEKNEVLEALSNRIQQELKQVYLTALKTDEIIQSPQVPYTVIINKRTMIDGVLELQHYIPDIREEVHVSNLVNRILLSYK